MERYRGPSLMQLRLGLRDLLPGGCDPEFLLQHGELFLALRAVADRVDQEVPADPDDASQDPRVVAFIALVTEAIDEEVPERSDRRLLKGVLGLYPESEGLRLKDRRKLAGGHFRGPTQAVSAGTLRVHFEPGALDQLAGILVRREAGCRREAPPDEAVRSET